MSESILSFLVSRFRQAFGEPNLTQNETLQWSLRRLDYQAAVNILVVTGNGRSVVWVFDPHEPGNGIFTVVVEAESEVDPLIQRIQAKVRQHGQPSTPHAL